MNMENAPRVLIVDDVDGSRDIVREVLESHGIEVVGEADSGELGIRLAVELKPDVILMDIRMKGIDGIEATRRVKRLLPELKVIVLSVFGDPPLVEEAMEAGATCLIAKGTSGINLAERVMDACGLTSHAA
jgi:NarL family two-component system response regulator LiaR